MGPSSLNFFSGKILYSPPTLSVLFGRTPKFHLKLSGKITEMIKSTGGTDICYTSGCGQQQLLTALQPIGIYKIHRGFPHIFLKNLTAFTSTYIPLRSNFIQCKILSIILINIRNHFSLRNHLHSRGCISMNGFCSDINIYSFP